MRVNVNKIKKIYTKLKNKYNLKLGIIIILTIALEFLIYITVIVPATSTSTKVPLAGKAVSGVVIKKNSQIWIEQDIKMMSTIEGVSFYLGTFEEEYNSGNLTVTVFDKEEGKELIKVQKLLVNVPDNTYVDVPFPKAIKSLEGHYCIRVMIDSKTNDYWFSFSNIKNKNADGYVSIDGVSQENYLRMILNISTSPFLNIFYCVIAIIILIIIGAGYFAIKRYTPETMFAILGLCFGILYMVVYPSYGVYDEERHIPWTFAKASAWSDGKWNSDPEKASIRLEETANMGFTLYQPTKDQYYHLCSTIFSKEEMSGSTETTFVSTSAMPYEYTPQIIGVIISRHLHLGLTATLYISQLLALIFYLTICYFAIRLSPWKEFFSIIALFPVSLRLAGSFSYDCFINAISLLLIALYLHMIYKIEKVSGLQIIMLIFLSGLLAPCKLIYVPFCLLVLAIPVDKWKTKWEKVVVFCIIICIDLFVIWIGMQGTLTNIAEESGSHIGPWGNTAYSISLLLHNFPEFVRITLSSFFDQAIELLVVGIGAFQKISLPLTLEIIMILWAMQSVNKDFFKISKSQKIIIFLTIVCVMGLGYTASIRWTTVGNYYYTGMQGRYLIPVFPLIFLLLGKIVAPKNKKRNLLYQMLLGNCYGVLYMMIMALW